MLVSGFLQRKAALRAFDLRVVQREIPPQIPDRASRELPRWLQERGYQGNKRCGFPWPRFVQAAEDTAARHRNAKQAEKLMICLRRHD
jgi:hypothetical protein